MPEENNTVYLIDDDSSIRRALGRVMTAAGWHWESFDSATSFLARQDLAKNGCIVADLTLVGMSGLELQQELNARRSHLPIIFLTASDSEELRLAAHHAGAAGFFRKPVDNRALLDAIERVLHPPSDSDDAGTPRAWIPENQADEPPSP